METTSDRLPTSRMDNNNKQKEDRSAPGLLRRLSTQRQALQADINEFKTNLVGKEVRWEKFSFLRILLLS